MARRPDMAAEMIALGSETTCRPITPQDVTERYVSWLNDKTVTRYTPMRWETFTLEGVRESIAKETAHLGWYVYAVEREGQMVGVAKVHCDLNNKTALISIIIGDKSAEGRRIAERATHAAVSLALDEHGMALVKTSVLSDNMASWWALERMKFIRCGTIPSSELVDGVRNDLHIYVMTRERWESLK